MSDTSSYDGNEVDEFYRELKFLADQIPNQDILVVQSDFNANFRDDAQEDWGRSLWNLEFNDRMLKLLDLAA